MCCCFFCNYTATTEIYTYLHTLSLPDALPICDDRRGAAYRLAAADVHHRAGGLRAGPRQCRPGALGHPYRGHDLRRLLPGSLGRRRAGPRELGRAGDPGVLCDGLARPAPGTAGAAVLLLLLAAALLLRSEAHTSELQSLLRSSYAGFCL